MNYGQMNALLSRLKLEGPPLKEWGICSNLLEIHDDYTSGQHRWLIPALGTVFDQIGLDGDAAYPIPGSDGQDNFEAYQSAHRAGTMWSTTEPYGQARWKVLDDAIAFCAAQPQDMEIV